MGFSVLLIDDDSDWLVFLGRLLDKAGFHVVPLQDSNRLAALIESAEEPPDLIVTDIMMAGVTASAVYGQVRNSKWLAVPVIICSGTAMKVKADNDPLMAHVSKGDATELLVREARRLVSLRPPMNLADDPDIDLPYNSKERVL